MFSTPSNFFAQIPDDVILHILSFLDPADLQSIELVSKQLATLCKNNEFWKRLLEKHFDVWVKDGTEGARELFIICYLLNKGRALEQNDFSNSKEYFKHAFQMLTQLTVNTQGMKEYLLGEMYLNGEAGGVDPVSFFQQSAILGNMNAKLILTKMWLAEGEEKYFNPALFSLIISDPTIKFSVTDTISSCVTSLKQNQDTDVKAAYELALLRFPDADLELVKMVDAYVSNYEDFSTKTNEYVLRLINCAAKSLRITLFFTFAFEEGNTVLQIKADDQQAKIYNSKLDDLRKQQTDNTLSLFETAVKLGSAKAALIVAKVFLQVEPIYLIGFKKYTIFSKSGTLDKKDDNKGIEYLQIATQLKSSEANYYLGCCYAYGEMQENPFCRRNNEGIVKLDIEQAIKYFTQGTEVAFSDNYATKCALALVQIYRYEQLSLEKVSEWSKNAAKLGATSSLIDLGKLYLEGATSLGLKPNLEMANKYFELAFSKERSKACIVANGFEIESNEINHNSLIQEFIKWHVRGMLICLQQNRDEFSYSVGALYHSTQGQIKDQWESISIKRVEAEVSTYPQIAQEIITLAGETYKAFELETPQDEYVDAFIKDFIQEQNPVDAPSKGMKSNPF